jgi:hypothetical protein
MIGDQTDVGLALEPPDRRAAASAAARVDHPKIWKVSACVEFKPLWLVLPIEAKRIKKNGPPGLET